MNADSALATASAYTSIGPVTFFHSRGAATGVELWKTDGTQTGTSLVNDVSVGTSSSYPRNYVNLNGNLLFEAQQQIDVRSNHIYTTNGSSPGTLLFESTSLIYGLAPIGTGAIFQDYVDLYITDGTVAGTYLIGSSPEIRRPVMDDLRIRASAAGGQIYYVAKSSPIEYPDSPELWVSDGTPGSAHRLMPGGFFSSSWTSNLTDLIDLNGTLYFVAHTAANGSALWQSSGTEATTFVTADVNPSTAGVKALGELTELNAKLLFWADDGTRGAELWQSNGTAGGTSLLLDIAPDAAGSAPSQFTRAGDLVYFVANDGVHGKELWRTNGTAAGTFMLADAESPTDATGPFQLTAVGDELYFAADGTMWHTDGSTLGTGPVLDSEGAELSDVEVEWGALGQSLLFLRFGHELWKTDATPGGTQFVASLRGDGAAVGGVVAAGEHLFFPATDSEHGREVWTSDGTASGVRRVTDIDPGSVYGTPEALTAHHNGALFWASENDGSARSLWKIDDLATGATRLEQFPTPEDGQYWRIIEIASAGDRIYFSVYRQNTVQLFVSDGTPDSSQLLLSRTTYILNLTVFDGEVFFTTNDAEPTLWKTDGTPGGTQIVKKFGTATGGFWIDIEAFNGSLYIGIAGSRTTRGTKLWKSDGTADGTMLVDDISDTADSLFGEWNFRVAGPYLYFTTAFENKRWLWRTDGTAEQTIPLVLSPRLPPTYVDSNSFLETSLAAFGNLLYFPNWDSEHGEELWQSDGTVAGTFRVSDSATPGGLYPRGFAVFHNNLYFSGSDDERGRGLWRLDLSTDPTINIFGAAITYTENALPLAITVSPASVSDVDSANFDTGKLTAQFTAGGSGNDRLAIRNTASLTTNPGGKVFYNSNEVGSFTGGVGTAPLVVTFTALCTPGIAGVILRNIVYSNVSDNPTPMRTVWVQVTDGDGGTSAALTKVINVTPVNDRPVINNFGGGPITFTEDGPSLAIAAATATISDPDSANFEGGTLTAKMSAGGKAEDRLVIRNGGLLATNNGQVLYNSVVIGTFTGGTGTTPLVVTFDSDATPAIAGVLLRNIVYRAASQNPSASPRTVWAQVTDGDGGTSLAVTKTLNVIPVNDAPVLSGIGGTIGYPLNSAASIQVAAAALVSDVDSPNFDTGKLTVEITSGGDPGNRLELGGTLFTFDATTREITRKDTNGDKIIGTLNVDGGVGTTKFEVTFNTNATALFVFQLVRALRFRTQDSASTDDRVLSFTLTDGDGGTSATLTKTVDVTP